MLSLYTELKGKRVEPDTTLKFKCKLTQLARMKLTQDLAYLLGALRDSTIDVRVTKNYEIKIAQTDARWLKLLQKIFKENFGKEGSIKPHVNDTSILRINDKKLVNKVLEISEMKIPQENWATPKTIKNSTLRMQLDYVRGFFDAEGGMPIKPLEAEQKYLSLSQKNRESLEFIRNILADLGLRPTKITICGKVWEFRLTRKKSIINFIEKIGSWHPEKIERFKLLKRALLSPNWRGSTQGVGVAVQLD